MQNPETLERRPLGRTGLEVTRIGFGALEIGRDWGLGDAAARLRPEAEEAGRVLDEGETVRAMKDAREAGKVRFLGASPGNALLARCIDSGDFDVLQVGYSLLDRGAHDQIARAADRGIGILIRSGLGAGWLTPRALTVPPEQRPEKVRALLALVDGDGERLH